jgi:multicomponent Na+:H+ antiporter subunit G
MFEFISEAMLWVAGIVVLIGSAGLLRFPDFYTRAHSATVVSVGGFTLALLGIALQNPFGIYSIKIAIVLIVNLLTNPTSTHALADSAYKLGIRPLSLVRDDLAKASPPSGRGGKK